MQAIRHNQIVTMLFFQFPETILLYPTLGRGCLWHSQGLTWIILLVPTFHHGLSILLLGGSLVDGL